MRNFLAWLWLLLAMAILFPIPQLWLGATTMVVFLATIYLTGPQWRDCSWFLPCLPLILAWYIPLPVPATLAPLVRFGVTIGLWLTIIILLLSVAVYLSQRDEPSPLAD